jgi:hypothetical protein
MNIERFWAWYFSTVYSDWITKYDVLHSVYVDHDAIMRSEDSVRGDKRPYEVYGIRLPDNRILVLGKTREAHQLRS